MILEGKPGDDGKLPNLYSQLPDYNKKVSGMPRDVPLNPTTKKFTHDYVIRSLNPELSAKEKEKTYAERVEGKSVLLTNPLRENRRKRQRGNGEDEGEGMDKEMAVMERLLKSHRKKTLSAREQRALKVYDIPKDKQSLWVQYIMGLLSGANANACAQKLIKADYHGAIITVNKSKCPSYVGHTGIVVQETKQLFRIITQDDRLLNIPKANSTFKLEVGNRKYILYGSHMLYRASERASKKFKPKPTVDL
ncbi:RNase P/RNase MRP complex subunit [Spiromyces aspiralis]|uniref:RNase P/RNase MRP complex subunit n=1 Tax=Spiromyces aspiralis TaxID=68401 RepID=A0ACC1HIV8_9FUNG|nr:RNase P/RNase MRP complex subunit [Spiromyces aspiralis]